MSSRIAAILPLYEKNLAYANRLVADIPDDHMTVQPAAGMNHAAWVLGHLAATSDRVAGQMLLGLEPMLPASWAEQFGPRTTPTSERRRYPGKDELVTQLAHVHQRIAGNLADAPDTLLTKPTPHERLAQRFALLGSALIHVLVGHEQLHLGQLSAWRRAQGMASV